MKTILWMGLAGVGLFVLWAVSAKAVGMVMDRVWVRSLGETRVGEVQFGDGRFLVAGVSLDLFNEKTMLTGFGMKVDGAGRAVFTDGGREFVAGPVVGTRVGVPGGDTLRLIREQGWVSWWTPMEMNFMTGVAASWRRCLYFRLVWEKADGARMEIKWRVVQGWFGAEGWRPAEVQFVTAGLMGVEMKKGKESR